MKITRAQAMKLATMVAYFIRTNATTQRLKDKWYKKFMSLTPLTDNESPDSVINFKHTFTLQVSARLWNEYLRTGDLDELMNHAVFNEE